MNRRKLHVKNFPAFLAVTTVLWLGPSASAQSAPAQDNDTTRGELARFDQFLDGHREVAEQLRRNPSLVNNQEFMENHPALQTFLQEHPGIRKR